MKNQPVLLLGAPVAEQLYDDTKQFLKIHEITWYLAIFMMWEKNPSAVYVRKKVAYAEKLGLEGRVFDYNYANFLQHHKLEGKTLLQQWEWDSTHAFFEYVLDSIYQCNNDAQCLWIIIQLPLPVELMSYKKELLDAVSPEKDVDCLGEKLLAISQVWTGELQVAPATPAATLHLLDYYYRGNGDDNDGQLFDQETGKFLKPHVISVLWESDLIGKPLIQMLKDRGATVHSFNEFSDQNQMRSICQSSDSIFAATGKLHLVDEQFVRDDQTQIIIDIGRGMLNGKAAGDVNTLAVQDKIAAITPVPWGIWPVTVASIFWNMCLLWEWNNRR